MLLCLDLNVEEADDLVIFIAFMAPSNDPQWLFVHRDAQHMKGDDREVFLINSYMSKNRRKANRALRLQELQSLTAGPSSKCLLPQSESASAPTAKLNDKRDSRKGRTVKHRALPGVIMFRHEMDRIKPHQGSETPHKQLGNHDFCLPSAARAGPRGDPFEVYPVPATPNVQRIFDSCKENP
jgi:hypothetical protein